MAMRRRWRGGGFRRRRPNVYWDQLDLAQGDLPQLLLNNANAGSDGEFTSVLRYNGADILLRRHLWMFMVQGTTVTTDINANQVVRICIGLTIMDDPASSSGQATRQTLAIGTGPESDADNSRWYVRCCVDIPVGSLSQRTVGQPNPIIYGPTNYVVADRVSSTTIRWTWNCGVDSKTIRKLQGLETEFVTLAMEGFTLQTPGTGESHDVDLVSAHGRHVIQLKR